MPFDLTLPQTWLWVCTIGLAITTVVLTLGRLRFARIAVGGVSGPPGEDDLAKAVVTRVHRFLILSGAQLLCDLAVLLYFIYSLYHQVTAGTPRAFLDAMPPIWPILLAAIARIALEFPIRATRRRILNILENGYA